MSYGIAGYGQRSPYHDSATTANIDQIYSQMTFEPEMRSHWFHRLHEGTREALAWDAFDVYIGVRTGQLQVVTTDELNSLRNEITSLQGDVRRLRGDAPAVAVPSPEPKPAKQDRVKVADNIFRRGERFQVIWQADGRQQQQSCDTEAEAYAFRGQLVAAGQIKPLASEAS